MLRFSPQAMGTLCRIVCFPQPVGSGFEPAFLGHFYALLFEGAQRERNEKGMCEDVERSGGEGRKRDMHRIVGDFMPT